MAACELRIPLATIGTVFPSTSEPRSEKKTSYRRRHVSSSSLTTGSEMLGSQRRHAAPSRTTSAIRSWDGLRMPAAAPLDWSQINCVHNVSVTKKSSKGAALRTSAVFERFTERAIKSVMLAQKEAKVMGRTEVSSEHLLLGLVAEDRSREGFMRTGLTVERAREAVRAVAASSGVSPGSTDRMASEIPFSASSKRVFEAALDESRRLGHNFIAPEHLLVSLLAADGGGAVKTLDRLGLHKDKLHAEAMARLRGEMVNDGRGIAGISTSQPETSMAGRGALSGASVSITRAPSRKEKGALADFCVDITVRASEGKIDPVIGRDKEVQRVIEILARRTKNNPILLGEPGVGKTAIAEGLSMRIAGGSVPAFLATKRVLSLDLGLLLAGAKERGELESRVTNIIREVKSAGNVILVIDEVHTLIGSGSVSRGSSAGASGLDIANLLKPALARGELQCIGATTLDEHRKHIEKDKALARRFQPVIVGEPSEADAVHILMGLRSRYEKFHRCAYTDEAVLAAVELSSRYIPDRCLPDKAIDLLDEAGSRARIAAYRAVRDADTRILRQDAADIWKEINRAAAAAAIREGGVLATQGSASVLDEKIDFVIDLDGDMASVESIEASDRYAVVGREEIAAVASLWSGVPLEAVSSSEAVRLRGLEEALASRVVGQGEAVRSIARAVQRARVGLQSPGRPIAAMLFCGPTGVGKTELTKALAEHYFGSESAMVRLDMSEYMERHSVSKLVGAPPGYVGYGEGGTLTEAVRRRPFSVVLLDEIEKAHPDIFNLLLQVFEDGHLTTAQGRKVSFKNTLLVMTSNVASKVIASGGAASGFGFDFPEEGAEGGSYSRLRRRVMDELRHFFRPELLNRLDEIVVFRSLERVQIRTIVELLLSQIKTRVAAQGLNLEVSAALVAAACAQGFDPTYGARPARRVLTRLVEDPLSEALLGGTFKEGDTALLDWVVPAGVGAAAGGGRRAAAAEAEGHTVVTRLPKPNICEDNLCLPVLKLVSAFSSSD